MHCTPILCMTINPQSFQLQQTMKCTGSMRVVAGLHSLYRELSTTFPDFPNNYQIHCRHHADLVIIQIPIHFFIIINQAYLYQMVSNKARVMEFCTLMFSHMYWQTNKNRKKLLKYFQINKTTQRVNVCT